MESSSLGSRNFKGLTAATSAWILLLVFIGAMVRATGSGLSCPDWPLCAGSLAPGGWLDLVHRGVAGLAALLTVTTAVLAWRSYRRYPLVVVPAVAAVGLVLLQAFLGAVTVWSGNAPLSVGGHLLAGLTYLGLTLVVTVAAHLPAGSVRNGGVEGPYHTYYFRFLLLTGAALILLLLTGVTVTGTQTGLACRDWPLCQGEIFPAGGGWSTAINLFHRFSVVVVGLLVAAVVLQTRRVFKGSRLLLRWSTLLGLAFLAQVGLGGLNVLTLFPDLISALHTVLAMAIWGSLVGLTTLFYLVGRHVPVEAAILEPVKANVPAREKAVIYFKLTKPWIMILLLITTLGAMFIAAEGMPSLPLILYTLLGGALSAGGASALNSYVDSDIDHVMSRTSRRPTVTGLVTPQETLFFGLALSLLSFLIFAIFVNFPSALLSTLGILYYVFFYTLYLKRATYHNIIIGGAAGSIPPLVGWTAVTGRLDLGAFYLFAIIFFWTPPHTWALALLAKKDYAKARVPMLPVVVGDKETTYQILLYSILLITLTLLPFAAHVMSVIYLIGAAALGIPFLYLAWRLWHDYTKSTSKRLYKFSQLYLALLFLVMALDRSLL